MIKINLSPQAIAKFASQSSSITIGSSSDNPRKAALVRFIILMIIPLSLYFYEQSQLPDILAVKNQKEKELSGIKSYNEKAAAAVKEIKKFKEDEAKIQARIGVLQTLSRDRQKEISLLDFIQQVLPEKIWLNKLDMAHGKMHLEGLSSNDAEISNFIEALSKSIFLAEVMLISTKEESVKGLKLKKFEISCMMDKGQGT